jgi:hypothetical protein
VATDSRLQRENLDALKQQQQEHDAFVNRMSPAEHLAAAKRLLRVDAPGSQIDEGMRHLAAINWTPLKEQGALVRSRYEKEKARADAEVAEPIRIGYATTYENNMLGHGGNVDVVALGLQHSTLQIRWVLATKVEAYQITNREGGFKGLFDDLHRLGFKKLVLTDGYDSRWTWNVADYYFR